MECQRPPKEHFGEPGGPEPLRPTVLLARTQAQPCRASLPLVQTKEGVSEPSGKVAAGTALSLASGDLGGQEPGKWPLTDPAKLP